MRFFNGTLLLWAGPLGILKIQLFFSSKQQLQKMRDSFFQNDTNHIYGVSHNGVVVQTVI